MAFNSVYAGGNAHYYAYSSSYYYMIYDRLRIYVDDGTGSDLDNDGSDEDLITTVIRGPHGFRQQSCRATSLGL